MIIPKRLYYPVEYNPRVDSRQAEYAQKRRKEEELRRRLRLQQRQRELLEEQYEQDFRELEGRNRR